MTQPYPFRPRASIRLGFTVLLACSCLVQTGLAQQYPTRNLTGTVEDPQHEPLKGAIVQVEDEGTHSVVSYITDETGAFSFKRLSGNADYRVWAKYRNHTSPAKELSHFDTNTAPNLKLIIELH